jgi:hypothetical protein
MPNHLRKLKTLQLASQFIMNDKNDGCKITRSNNIFNTKTNYTFFTNLDVYDCWIDKVQALAFNSHKHLKKLVTGDTFITSTAAESTQNIFHGLTHTRI